MPGFAKAAIDAFGIAVLEVLDDHEEHESTLT